MAVTFTSHVNLHEQVDETKLVFTMAYLLCAVCDMLHFERQIIIKNKM